MALEELFGQLGGFSRFQLLMIFGVYTMKFMTGFSMMMMSFGGVIPDYHCVIDRDSSQSVAKSSNHSVWSNQSQPIEDTLNTCSVNGTACTRYEFLGHKRTVISEWDLVCDLKWVKATVTSIQMGGVLLGAVIAGQSGDYFGRKKTIYGFYLANTIFNVVGAFCVSWQMFIVFRFLIGIAVGGLLVMVVPYPSEFLPLRWRALIPVLPMWPFGVAFMAGAAYVLEDWSHLHLACAAFCVPGLLGYFYIPDSVRWLAVHGRLKEAHDVIEKMAQVNGREVPPSTKEVLQRIAEEEKKSRVTGQQYSYLDVFKGEHMARTTLIFAFKWACLSVIFYGLSFGVSSFAGNIYLNIFLMSVVEVPANILGFFLINKFGRRLTCQGFLAIGCVAAFSCLIVHFLAPESQRGAMTSGLSLAAKLCIGACWVASQIWVVEIYPTVTRSLGYGIANVAARVGGIVAPFAVNLDEDVVLPYALVGSLQLACVILISFIPDTKDKALPETIQDQGHQDTEFTVGKDTNGTAGVKDSEESNVRDVERTHVKDSTRL